MPVKKKYFSRVKEEREKKAGERRKEGEGEEEGKRTEAKEEIKKKGWEGEGALANTRAGVARCHVIYQSSRRNDRIVAREESICPLARFPRWPPVINRHASPFVVFTRHNVIDIIPRNVELRGALCNTNYKL